MATKMCPLTYKRLPEHMMVKVNNYHYFDPQGLKDMIYHAYLGIPIDLASEEEWIITVMSDTQDGSDVLRFRNPLTGLGFTEDELKRIYSALSLYGDNNVRRTRATR